MLAGILIAQKKELTMINELGDEKVECEWDDMKLNF